MPDTSRATKAIIVGAGPVGCLVAIALRQRGIEVEVYEKNADIRESPPSKNHSFNLTLTRRGLTSLEPRVIDLLHGNGVPMPQRVVHHADGAVSHQPYGAHPEHHLLSIPRDLLHRTLLDEADRAGARLLFEHTCVRVNPAAARAHFAVAGKDLCRAEGDLVIGCDGANSIVRYEMGRRGARMSVSQDYVEHGFVEVRVPPTKRGAPALLSTGGAADPRSGTHGLHVWPRGEHMLMAQPNVDNTYTASLFMPLDRPDAAVPSFASLRTGAEVRELFERDFADMVDLVPTLTDDFFAAPPSPLKTVRVHPYHHGRTVLVGDSSHTMVPFFGQGINCSFEDVRQFLAILDEALERGGDDAVPDALARFTAERKGPGDAISELSMLNLRDLTSGTDSGDYHTRKRLERELHDTAGEEFIPLYHMVAFTDIPYDEVIERHTRQSARLDRLCGRYDMATEADDIIAAYTTPSPRSEEDALVPTRPGTELDLTRTQLRGLLTAVTERILAYQERLTDGGYPASYLRDADPGSYHEGRRTSARLAESTVPEHGSELDDLLAEIFDEVITTGMVHPHAGSLSHIPSGGLFQAAVGEFVARVLNRFVGVWAAAPGFAQLETNVVRWFCRMLGYGDKSFGYLTTGGSLANFMAVRCALDHAEAASGPGATTRFATVYVSDQGHFSVAKAARLAGVSPSRVRVVTTRADHTMDLTRLAELVEHDRRQGMHPALVVATAGTTNTGAVDDLTAITRFCREQHVWMHADACFGGFFRLTERGRTLLAGIEQADSIAVDAHKSLFLPHGSSALLVRDGENLRSTFEVPGAGYIPELSDDPEFVDFCNYGPELTREVRGLTAWLPIKMHGIDAFRRALDDRLDLADEVADRLREFPELEVVPRGRTHLPVVAFHVRADTEARARERTDRLRRLVCAKARVYVATSEVPGTGLVIRTCVLHHRTDRSVLDRFLDDIRTSLTELDQEVEHDDQYPTDRDVAAGARVAAIRAE